MTTKSEARRTIEAAAKATIESMIARPLDECIINSRGNFGIACGHAAMTAILNTPALEVTEPEYDPEYKLWFAEITAVHPEA